jgi:hypothetical protein
MELAIINDTKIPNQEILYRRISTLWMKFENGQWRVSTGAFTTKQMSVHLASRISPDEILASYPTHRLVSFTAKDIRELGCIFAKERDDLDPSHFLVCPEGNLDQKISKSIAKKLIKKVSWVSCNPPQSAT